MLGIDKNNRTNDTKDKDERMRAVFERLSAENQSYILGKVEGLREAQQCFEEVQAIFPVEEGAH
ncbi:MAG: hypothetical protein LBT16_10885 [Treponema sp.]|jgi:hypothetical protein|nr:hypothetical protein [Treponema sp.]